MWCSHLHRPHYKFCICIDYDRRWFFYIDSAPPPYRKARTVAVAVENFELQCLHKPVSYIDTTSIIDDLPDEYLAQAVVDQDRRHGPLLQFLIDRIKRAVESHGSLTEEQKEIIRA